MEQLKSYVDEFIIVVKYKKEAIINYFGNEYQWIPIRYHEQWEEKGTWAAIKWIKASGDIVIAYADALFSQRDIDSVMQTNWYAVLAKEVEDPRKYGIFQLDINWYIEEVVEKPQQYIWNLANFSFFKVNDIILQDIHSVQLSPRWEIEITDAINMFVSKNKMEAVILKNDFIDITSPEDLEAANILLKPELWQTRYLGNIWNYEIHLGIPQTGIQEIVDYSTDKSDAALREWTSDWKKRFISVKNLTTWYNDEDRYPFTLLSSDWVVAWLWWWRPAKLPHISEVLNQEVYDIMLAHPDNIHTSGIRIYPFARWERLASPFMKACERYYTYIFDDIYMSDDVWAENIPSQKAFERLWYIYYKKVR